tara:strand:+ start:227 stop:769 length:543 start_codon:yes stop_codon:yes gene_type:complete
MSSIIKYKDKNFIEYLSSDVIQRSIKKIARDINFEYKNKSPLFIGVLNGSVPFMMDLLNHIDIDYQYEFMKISSYNSMNRDKIKLLLDIDADRIKNNDIIIVEDIIDSGNTIEYLRNKMLACNPNSLKVVTLLCKSKKTSLSDWYCFELKKNKYVIGYGLDINNLFRNLNSIYIENNEKK